MKGSTTEESIAEASRGNDTIEAEAWAERTSVITSFDHEIHCALARDFVEDIVEKVVQHAEGWPLPPLPDLVKDSHVDESDESEYESADETIVDNKKSTVNTTFEVTDSDDFSLRLDSVNDSSVTEESLLRSPVKTITAINTTIELDGTIDLETGTSIHYESVLEVEQLGETLPGDPAGETIILSEKVELNQTWAVEEETLPGEVPDQLVEEVLPGKGNAAGEIASVPGEALKVPELKLEETPVDTAGVPVQATEEEPLIPGEDSVETCVPESPVAAPGESILSPREEKEVPVVPESSVVQTETPGESPAVPEEDTELAFVPESPLISFGNVPGHQQEETKEVSVVAESSSGEPEAPGEAAAPLVDEVTVPADVPCVPEPLTEQIKATEVIVSVPELTSEELQTLENVPVVPEQPTEVKTEEPPTVPKLPAEDFKVPEVPVAPEPSPQESVSTDDIPIPKKGYDLSFLDNLEDLENISPDAVFGTKTSSSKAPAKKPVIRKRPPQAKKDLPVPKRPEVPAESVLEEKKDPPVPELLEAPADQPVFEEKKDLEKEVLEQELIVPKKGYDLSFLDKLEDLENAAPDTIIHNEANINKEMKETTEAEPSSDQKPSDDQVPPPPSSSSQTEAKARINNRRIVKPRPVVTRGAVDAESAPHEFNAEGNPFKAKNKLAASPTSATQTFQIPPSPLEKETAEAEEKESVEVLEHVTNDPSASAIDLSAETFRPAAEILNDPAEMDFLLKFGGSSNAIALARQSLFANFDPLIAGRPSLFPAKNTNDASLMEETQLNDSINNGDSLFVFSPPHPSTAAASAAPAVVAAAPVAALQPLGEADLSNAHLKEALKMQELLFQDRLLQKDRDLLNKDREMGEVKTKLEATVEAQSQMKQILGEYEKTISQLIAEKEREKATMETELQKAIKEKDQAAEDLKEVERAFSEFHRMYERTKAAAEGLHKNEEALKKAVAAYQERLQLEQQKYETLKLHASQKLESAQQETENIKRGFEAESARMKALLKKTEMRLASVESTLEQRNKENEELTKLCDELINRLGAAQ